MTVVEEPTINSKDLNKKNINISKVGSEKEKENASANEGGLETEGQENGTPKGKVSCLLCRGFITYKSSDRTRFREHMENEHDVKFDSDVILAISVMTAREKQHIVASAMARLAEISNNKIPTSGEALLPKPSPAAPEPTVKSSPAAIPSSVSTNNTVRYPAANRGRGGSVVSSPASRGGRGSYRGTVIRPARPPAPAQSGARGKAPFNIQNMSISISVVDQTVKCSQCSQTFRNSNVLAEHTKSVHLARFASLGLSITAPGEKKTGLPESAALAQSPGPNKRPRAPGDVVRTPPTKVQVQQPVRSGVAGRGRGRGGAVTPGSRIVGTQVKTEPSTTRPPTNTRIQQQHQGVDKDKVDPVIKCNDCGKFIKQSVFKEHKLEHAKEKDGGSGSNKTGQGKANNSTTVPEPKGRVVRRKEEKQMDFVDLGEESDEDEVTDVTQKKVLEKKLPCPSCDIMFATTMSLKMHMNLSHPVKMEATETEQLLSEGQDKEAGEDDTDKVMEEMNNIGTSEMLDDLVNFLNEL